MNNLLASRGHQTLFFVPLFMVDVDNLLKMHLKPVNLIDKFECKMAELSGAEPLKKYFKVAKRIRHGMGLR